MNGVSPAAENDEAQIETGEIPVKQMMKKFGGTGEDDEIGQADANDESANVGANDDRTEDQVPDITGTTTAENIEVTTTSMDGVEEIKHDDEEEVTQKDADTELPDENEKQTDEVTENDVAEIPVTVTDVDADGDAGAKTEDEAPEEEEESEGQEIPVEQVEVEQAEVESAPPPEDEEGQQDIPVETIGADEEEAAGENEEEQQQPQEGGEEVQEVPVEVVEVEEQEEKAPEPLAEAEDEGEVQEIPVEVVDEEPQKEAEEEEAPPVEAEKAPSLVNGDVAAPGTPRSVRSGAGSQFGFAEEGSRRGSRGSALEGSRRGSNLSAPKTPTTPKEIAIASPIPATPLSAKSTGSKKSGGAENNVFEFNNTADADDLSVSEASTGSPRRSPSRRRRPKTTSFEVEQPEELLSPTKARRRKKRVTGESEGDSESKSEPAVEELGEDEEARKPSMLEEEDDRMKLQLQWARQAAAAEGVEIPERKSSTLQVDTVQSDVAAGDETVEESGEGEKQPAEEGGGEEEKTEAEVPIRRVAVASPPESPAPIRSSRRAEVDGGAGAEYKAYDQDSHREDVPARLPSSTSFSSWATAERTDYKPISPWVNSSSKYRNEYTVGEAARPKPAYSSYFDDLVSIGPFNSQLYSSSRYLERGRSRSRRRAGAGRNLYRFSSQIPAPLRTRDYSTAPTGWASRAPSRASSFISFLEYSGAKQYDLARSRSLSRPGSLYNSNLALSRSSSRGGVDYYLGTGRMSRVDSYVSNLHTPYEWKLPNYNMYRSVSRDQVGYVPLNEYSSYVGDLQRSLSKERYERDRLRSKYTKVAYQLELACKQMDVLRSYNYAPIRSGSAPRTSVYSSHYPYL